MKSKSLHIGLLVPPFVGHLRPAAVLARALSRRGHRVRILSYPDAVTKLAKSGVDLTTFGERTFPPGEWDRRVTSLGAAEGREIYWQVFQLLLDQCHCMAAELPAALERLKLDGLIVDQLCYAAEGVTESLGVPMVIACNALPFHRESRVPLCFRHWDYNPALWARVRNKAEGAWNILTGWRMSLFYLRHRRALGLRPPALSHINEVPPSLAQVAQIPEFFDFPRRRLPDHFHYTGPWLESGSDAASDFPWDRLDGRPLIYASLGTLQNGVRRWFEIIVEACRGLDAQLVLALGRGPGGAGTFAPELRSRALVVDFAPQRALLSRAALVITHAGLNSTLEILSAGVPSVAVPISHDQPGVAARLRRLGASRVIPATRLTVDRLHPALAAVLNTPSFGLRARECAYALRQVDGPDLAADVIERAFRTRQRVVRACSTISPKKGSSD